MPWSLRRAEGTPIEIGDVVVIGRDPTCDVCVEAREVSRIQCRVVLGERGPVLENVSRYGTLVNGALIEEHVDLADGDRIEVGGELLEVTRPRRTAFFAGEADSRPPELPRFGPHAPRNVGGYTVDLLDDEEGRALRYHDSVAVEGGGCLLMLLEVREGGPPDILATMGPRCRELVREGAKRGATPGELLTQIHVALLRAGARGRASAARADLVNDVVVAACAGSTSPWVLRAAGRVARVQLPATVDLGTARSMQFENRIAHFERGDCVLLANDAGGATLEALFGEALPEPGKLMPLLRERVRGTSGAVFALSRT